MIMSLNWEWKDKMGEAVYEDGTVCNIYKGNAYMICLREDETTYSLNWFACDKQHWKRMLSINKNDSSDYPVSEWGIKKFRFNARYTHVPEIVQLIAKAKFPIEIELYQEST